VGKGFPVEQPKSDETHQIVEFVPPKPNGSQNKGIQAGQHRLDRAQAQRSVAVTDLP
jgi:hypothetical protein